MNFCFCGYFGDFSGCCCCILEQVQCYWGKLFGLLFDCIDLYVSVFCESISLQLGYGEIVIVEVSEWVGVVWKW